MTSRCRFQSASCRPPPNPSQSSRSRCREPLVPERRRSRTASSDHTDATRGGHRVNLSSRKGPCQNQHCEPSSTPPGNDRNRPLGPPPTRPIHAWRSKVAPLPRGQTSAQKVSRRPTGAWPRTPPRSTRSLAPAPQAPPQRKGRNPRPLTLSPQSQAQPPAHPRQAGPPRWAARSRLPAQPQGFGSASSPVAAGISLPMMTFSLSPTRRSRLPSRAASVRTFVVSWKEAAERKDSVASEAFVMPRMTSSPLAGVPPSSLVFLFNRLRLPRSSSCPGSRLVEPFDSIRTFFSIWRAINSMCLSLISTPWAR